MPDWIATRFPPDHRGPTGRPFTPFPDANLGVPVLALLQAAATRHPHHIAIEDPSGPTTFAALWSAITRLAHALAPTPGPIAILLPPTADYAIAIFATLAAGRIALLLDATHPADRNAAIAARAGATQTLTAIDAPPPPDGPLPTLPQDAPALLLPTSGSTGHPKIIAHSQRTMLHWVRTIANALHLTPDDRILSISSPASLGGLTALLTAPLAGASIQILGLQTGGFATLLDTLRTRPITILRAGPSHLRTLVQLPRAGDAFARLRVVQTYGEPLLHADLALLRPHLAPGCHIRSTYGATEASGLAWFAGPPDDHDPIRVATGTLMPDTTAQIRDEQGRLCPPNQPGELLIRSPYNALGEWQDGVLTPASRIHATGDLARCTPDGVFTVLGRRDRMVNINGQRAEPAEIEAVLRRNPHILQAAIVARQTGATATFLAFAVPRAEAPPNLANHLRTELRANLPPFLQPSRLVLLDALPLLPGGKLDEAALLAIL